MGVNPLRIPRENPQGLCPIPAMSIADWNTVQVPAGIQLSVVSIVEALSRLSGPTNSAYDTRGIKEEIDRSWLFPRNTRRV